MNIRIRKNNLLPWFTDDHRTLPDAYLRHCRQFFQELGSKQQATSVKLQATKKQLFSPGVRVKNRFNRKV